MTFETIRWAIASIVIVTGCGLAALPARAADPLDASGPNFPKAGSSWVVSYKLGGSFGNSTGTFPVSVVGDQVWNGRPAWVLQSRSTLYFDPQGRQLARGNGSTILESWDPYWSGREWPLSVGKSWTSSPKLTNHSNGQTSAVKFTHTVQSAEEVTTPAGTFDTLKIVHESEFNRETEWWSPKLGVVVKKRTDRKSGNRLGVGVIDEEVVSYTAAP